MIWLLGPAGAVYAELDHVEPAGGRTDCRFAVSLTHAGGVRPSSRPTETGGKRYQTPGRTTRPERMLSPAASARARVARPSANPGSGGVPVSTALTKWSSSARYDGM